MMLRLCSIVNRAYISDLDYLGEYLTISDKNTFVNESETIEFVVAQHTLNEVGVTLYQILTDNPVVKTNIPRRTGSSASIGAMSTVELNGILKLFPTE